MIYFVDEDVAQIGAWATTIRIRGYKTCIIRDADQAYEQLKSCDDIELVFIDVMLAASPDPQKRRFLSETTDDFHSTGLELLKELNAQRPLTFPSKAVLLSHTGRQNILAKIDRACEQFKIPFWRKRSFSDLHEFSSKAEQYLNSLKRV